MFFGRLKRFARQVAYYLLMQTLMIFIPFSASAWVLYVASPTIFKVLVFGLLSATVHVFVFVSKTTKYSEDLVSAIAAVIARAAMLVAIGIIFI